MAAPEIHQIASSQWAATAARLVQGRIEDTIRRKGQCNVVLTGGRSAERLYGEWGRMLQSTTNKGLRFYFGDERCVPADHIQSNYGMAMRTLFSKCSSEYAEAVHRMEADVEDVNEAAHRYGNALPPSLDVVLLGVGEDGHIASLFPRSPALHERHRRVVPVDCPKAPNKRLTITPPVIAQAVSIFVLASGVEKAKVLQYALRDPGDFLSMPARLVLHATWLLDMASPEAAED